ncbi:MULTISPECIES: O-antigen ligase family protein [Methylosinus]|uniref:Polymerase n=1 Tax=Methylosinus trichosporium (strain ATCC 35070 / NCIMB 11131 / UNIQEM 75 / OB3b) TaxID=595536 RepID=A0A2D2CZ09_METT3|nr:MULTISPECIES: O-antigen ligase family protein [Methylosinus]ATQ67983.1 polymerase [Methylosinus trichosporium OB3b]OBS53736.1 hypothetical protein A8B73_04365 [Methylosinus sp. 3S-1]
MSDHLLLGATGVVIVASVLLGGGAHSGLLSDALLELIALPALLLGAWAFVDLPRERRPRFALPFFAALGALFLVQLVPLPPALWTRLPEREMLTGGFALLGRGTPWASLSVDPHFTRASLATLVAPIAVFLGASCLRLGQRRLLLLLLAPLAMVSVLIGLLQLAQGPESPLRFYRPTNITEAVGFFANRNHFSALLYCALAAAGAWTFDSLRRSGGARALVADTPRFIAALAGATTFVIMLAGEAMARSRAGLALALVAVVGVALLAHDGQGESRDPKARRNKLWFVLGALSLGVALQIPLHRVAERLSVDHVLEDARWTMASRSLETALAFLPFGSGIGSFVPVYAAHERPQDLLPNLAVNHVHDDFLELLLEGGAAGAALILAFVAWWGWRSAHVWRSHSGGGDLYARAASLIVGLLLLHSFVDYPLRASAMATVLALACALLAAPDQMIEALPVAPEPPPSHKRRRRRPQPTPAPTAPEVRPSPAGKLEGFEWPDQWKGS